MSKTGEAVLGCCILNFPTAMPLAYDRVQSTWWTSDEDKAIWNELSAEYAFGGYLDQSLAKKRTQLNEYVDRLCADATTPLALPTYLNELERDYKSGMWKDVASSIVDTSKNPGSADELDESVMRIMMQAFASEKAKDGTSAKDGAQKFEDWYKSPQKDVTWAHPFMKFGTYRASNIITVSAYSGVGKSWLGLQYLEAACRAGAGVHYYSLEMSEVELQARLISMGSNVDTQEIEDRTVPIEKFQDRLYQIANYDYTVFTGMTGPGRIFGSIRKAKASKRPLDVVIVDHLHLLQMGVKHSEYRLALDTALNQFKGVAQDSNVCFILLAQLRKYGNEEKAPPKPSCAMLKDTSAIEQISDLVVFLNRGWADGDWLETGQCYVGKKRNGKKPFPVDVQLTNRGFVER